MLTGTSMPVPASRIALAVPLVVASRRIGIMDMPVHLIVVPAFPGSQRIAVTSSESELGVHYGEANKGISIGII